MANVNKNWTPEQVWEAQSAWHKANPYCLTMTADSPFAQWTAAIADADRNRQAEQFRRYEEKGQRERNTFIIELCREKVESGEVQFYLMRALYAFAECGLPLPDWLRNEFIERHNKVYSDDLTSWDDVFGKPHPKGKHLAKARQRRDLARPVFRRIRYLLRAEPETPIDDGLFDRVAAEFGIGRTRCKEFYYDQKEMHPYEGNASRPCREKLRNSGNTSARFSATVRL